MARGGVQGAIERAAPTLAAAHAISRAVNIPVMAASGLSDVTAPMALAAGARGVGVGSAGEELYCLFMGLRKTCNIRSEKGTGTY